MRTYIKICGITCFEDGFEAARLGADFLGFVFYPPSPRCIPPERAGDILRRLRGMLGEKAPRAIGVFVDEPPARMAQTRRIAELDGVQFSGDEPPEAVAAQAPIRFRGLSIQTLDRLGRYDVEAYLCDTHAPEKKGGTGVSYDYEILRPHLSRYPLMVAGGLTPETVGAVVSSLHPWGVDVSSSVEASPGRKDGERVRAFIEAVRKAENEGPPDSSAFSRPFSL